MMLKLQTQEERLRWLFNLFPKVPQSLPVARYGLSWSLIRLSSSEIELPSPQLPFPIYHFGYGSVLAQAAPLGWQLLFALSLLLLTWPILVWACSLWTLLDAPAPDCALPFVSRKLPLPPHLGAVMSFPFDFFFYCSVVVYSNSDMLLDWFACFLIL